jgi:hypothetical protein
MHLSRPRKALVPGSLALLLLFASGCSSYSTPTQTYVLGRIQVAVTDTAGAAVPQLSVNLTLTNKSIWRASLTSSDGKAEFGASEGGVIIQNYLVHLILTGQYVLAPNETNDKPVTPIENQLIVVQFEVMKTSITPPA